MIAKRRGKQKRGRKAIVGLGRVNFMLTDYQMKRLGKEAKGKSMSMSTLLRQILDERYSSNKNGLAR